MKLRPEYEAARSNLMNRDPSPSLDVCFKELLHEEQRLATQTILQQNKMHDNAIAYATAHGKSKGRDMRQVQCFSCKEYEHIAVNCAKKFCNYCKKPGHIIKECPTRPQNHQASQAAVANQVVDSSTTVDKSVLTLEMVQQMIITAFSTLGLQGKRILPSSSWLVDSGASNHMTNSSDTLSNVKKYYGNIKIANGSKLPIHAIGDNNSSIKDVLASPQLSTNLISVRQLVDNNCDVRFSRDGYIVQDQVSGKILAKGPKVECLFPLHFSVSNFVSLVSIAVNQE
ncbi:hypothetical protein AB3S75_017303 [Citrus x aurantiifolia]